MNKVVYTDDVTVIEAQNLNDIQDAVIDTVPKSAGGTFNGTINIDQADGTTSAQGWSELRLGNNKVTGTEGNSAGNLQIYGRTAYKTEIIHSSASPTANRVLYLPDKSGTIMTDQGGTFSKPVAIDEHNGTASSLGASHLTLGNSIASGTAGNSTASLTMYGRQSYYTALYTAETLTSNRSIYFPDAGGTLTVNQVGTWTPQLYDYETLKLSLGNVGEYIRIGSLAVFSFNTRIDTSVTYSTMLQVRGFPFSVRIFGGNMYCAGVTNNFADRTIQYASNTVFLRPNFTGTIGSGFWWSGMFIGIVA